jgi:hypothetical protein
MASTQAQRVDRVAQAIRASRRPSDGRRFVLDTTGTTKNLTSRGFADRAHKYAEVRQLTVAKLLVLGEKLRDAGAFDRFGTRQGLRVTATGAYWQAFQGTTDWPACHTSPALLLFNRYLPHVLPRWANVPGRHALAVRIIDTFGHCVLMPQSVNRIDQALDEAFGGEALVEAMTLVRDGADAREAVWHYQHEMVEIYEPLTEVSPAELARVLGRLKEVPSGPASGSSFRNLEEDALIARLDDPNHQVLETYLDVHRRDPPRPAVEAFAGQVDAEIHAGTGGPAGGTGTPA